jgi:hypothetical protein
MVNDVTDNNSIFIAGRYQGSGSIQKYQKRDGRLLLWMRFN